MNLTEQQLCLLLSNGWWQHLDTLSDLALASEPDSSLAIASKAFACLRDGRTEQARDLFHDALAIDASDVVPRIGLFWLHYQDANFLEADELLKSLLLEFPNDVGLRIAQCRLYTMYKCRKRTDQTIQDALMLHPENEELRTIELYHAYKGDDENHKVTLSQQLLQLAPENALAHLILGHACINQRDYEAAEQHLKVCISFAPCEETALQLRYLVAAKTGKGLWRLAAWAYRRKILKFIFPRHYLRKRVKLRWGR